MAALVTSVAASSGGLSWMLVEFFHTGFWSGFAFCSGAVAGLVSITPAAGFVAPWAAIIIGLSAGVLCRYSIKLKDLFGYDDSLDALGIHGVGGLWGSIMTGVFAQKSIAILDGTVINGGWVDGNFIQVGYQLAGSIAIALWSFFISLAILLVINCIPTLHLACHGEDQILGTDMCEIGEPAYHYISDMSHNSKLSEEMKFESTGETLQLV